VNRRFGAAWPVLALLGIPFAFLLVFEIYPLEGIVRESFFRQGSSIDDLHPLVADTYYLGRAWFTLWQAALSTVLTLALAIPCAWALGRHEFRGKSVVIAISTIPFVLPTIVVAVAFTALIGPQGLINDALQRLFGFDDPPIAVMNTVWIILAAHVFYNFAVASRIIGAAWARLDSRLEDAAGVLGAGPIETFFRVTLPLLRPAILAAASLVFLFCFTSFGVVLILGGAQYGTIETEIYRETAFLFRLPVAAALALLQLLFTFAVMAAYTRLQRGTQGAGVSRPMAGRGRRRERALVRVIVMTMLLLTTLPLAALVERSFHGPGGYTLDYYRELGTNTGNRAIFVEPFAAIVHSLGFAALTVLFAVPLGTLAAYGSSRLRRGGAWVEALLLIPLGVSAITLALGFIVTFDSAPLNLRSTWLLIVIAHTLVAYPFVARTVGVQLRGMDPKLREAGRVLGANWLRVFMEIDLPLVWRSIAVGAVLAFAVSMGEFGATLLITRPEWATIPVAIFRLLGRPGSLNYGEALAMSTILMAVTTAGFVIIDRLRYRELGTF
jgi:thiamine transport system permease protein